MTGKSGEQRVTVSFLGGFKRFKRLRFSGFFRVWGRGALRLKGRGDGGQWKRVNC